MKLFLKWSSIIFIIGVVFIWSLSWIISSDEREIDLEKTATVSPYIKKLPESTEVDGTEIAINTSDGDQQDIDIVWNGSIYFVVWADYRRDDANIYGTRISQNGVVLDPDGIPISTAPNSQTSAKLSWDGQNFFVVWNDKRNEEDGIYGARISPDGQLLDPNGILIYSENNQYFHDIAWNGEEFLVVWDQSEPFEFADIYGLRIDSNGQAIDSSPVIISAHDKAEQIPNIISNGNQFLITWQDYRNIQRTNADIYGTFVNNGIVSNPSGIRIFVHNDAQYTPRLAWNGLNYFCLWNDMRHETARSDWELKSDIYGIKIDSSGNVDRSATTISMISKLEYDHDITAKGSDFLAVWLAGEDTGDYNYKIYGEKINSNGRRASKRFLITETQARLPTTIRQPLVVASDGNQFLVVWEDGRSWDRDIYGKLFSFP